MKAKMIETLKDAGFEMIEEGFILRFAKEGFEGTIEIHGREDYSTWGHRTALNGAGSGLRPIGGPSVKKLAAYING